MSTMIPIADPQPIHSVAAVDLRPRRCALRGFADVAAGHHDDIGFLWS